MKIVKTITSKLLVGFTALALIVGSAPKEVHALTGNGGSTGWNRVSTTNQDSCAQKAVQTMKWLVEQGEIQTLPDGNSWRFRKGNNVIFNVVCDRNGENVRVDVICFNACDRATFNLRSRIDGLMNW